MRLGIACTFRAISTGSLLVFDERRLREPHRLDKTGGPCPRFANFASSTYFATALTEA